jgi:glutamate-1-semialdehyde aminotransferase
VNPWALAGLSALLIAFAAGYQTATTRCDAAHYRAQAESLSAHVAQMQARLETVNRAAEAHATRARAHAERLAELQELIDAIPDDDRMCLGVDAASRLRLIR